MTKRFLYAAVLLAVSAARGEIKASGDVDAAVERGLAAIARTRRAATQPVAEDPRVALAYLAAGHMPGRGPLGLAMRQSLAATESAAATITDGDRAVTAVVLLEAASLEEDATRRDRLTTTAKSLLSSPVDTSAPTEDVAWFVLATRRLEIVAADAALPTGLIETLRSRLDPTTGLATGETGTPSLRASAAALVALDAAGAGEGPLFSTGVASLLAMLPQAKGPRETTESMWLAWLAVRLPGEKQDVIWKHVRPAVLARQQEDGSFAGDTPAAVLALSVAYRALPVTAVR